MRTTLEIDEDVLQTAKIIANESDQSLGRVVSDLMRKALESKPVEYTIRNGVPVFPSRPGAPKITTEMIRELLDQDE